METRTLGKTDLTVTRLGFGGARLGYEDVTPDEADRLLNGLLDVGVTFVDTAACYHDSEEQIGQWIGARREEYVLASKCGHVTGGATGRGVVGGDHRPQHRPLPASDCGPTAST